MNKILTTLFGCIVFSINNAHAYKTGTHEAMSENAILISDINLNATLLQDLGLDPLSSNQTFLNPNDLNGPKLTITRLVRDGSRNEDVLYYTRAFNHFYNPVSNIPLTVGIELGNTSPDWALEDTSEAEHGLHQQIYSYRHANEYLYLALTSPASEQRELNWANVFLTLGHVIHHVQDMAQPDHTRNDQHADPLDPSYFEMYTDRLRSTQGSIVTILMLGEQYPIPKFSTPRGFWTTRNLDYILDERRGLADFSNKNFVSKDTMFLINNGNVVNNPEHPQPEPLPQTPNPKSITELDLFGASGTNLCESLKASLVNAPNDACYIDFIASEVTDSNTGNNSINDRAASHSLFNKHLDAYDKEIQHIGHFGYATSYDRVFTLNQFNFDKAYTYLIPRAVSYSAGLLNHFFRASFETEINIESRTLTITNTSDSIMFGTFELYADDPISGTRHLIQSWLISDDFPNGLPNGNDIIFNAPDLTSYGTKLTLVFKGNLDVENSVDYIYANTLNLNSKTQGVFSFYRDQQTQAIYLNIHTNLLHNFTNIQLDSFIRFDGRFVVNNQWVYRYTVENFHWSIVGNYPDECYFEAIGNWTVDDPGYFDPNPLYWKSDHKGINSASNGLIELVGLTAIPYDIACQNTPYGYRANSWEGGWISKFPIYHHNNKDLGFLVESGSGLGVDLVAITSNNTNIVINNTCQPVTLEDINPTWVPNSDPAGYGATNSHAFTSHSSFINDAPFTTIKTYIEQNINVDTCH